MLGGRSRRSLGGGATAVRITAILTAVGCCLAAAAYAYATTRPAPSTSDTTRGSVPLRPRILSHPNPVTTESLAVFDFSQPARPAARAHPDGPPIRFECRLDDGGWEPCRGPITLTGITRGVHRFAVHAVNRAGNEGPATFFNWRRARERSAPVTPPAPAPEPPASRPTAPTGAPPVVPPPVEEHEAPPAGPSFAIEQVGTLAQLFPGAAAQTIGVRVDNPNPEPLTVTSLTAAIAADPPGCPAAENFVLTPAAVNPSAPLLVPAESSVSLPAEGIAGPTIEMLDLPTSQDACQEAELTIDLSGQASG